MSNHPTLAHAATTKVALVAGLDGLIASVRASDTLLAVGSVVSGLGSRASQLDLLLIGTGSQQTGTAASVATVGSATYQLSSGAKVGVRFCTDKELDDLSTVTRRFEEAFFEPAMFANLPNLDIGAQVLLHEIRTGIVLTNVSIAQAWREQLRLRFLHRHIAAMRFLRFAARRRNVIGQLDDGDIDTAQWTLREGIEELMAAALAAVGETNPRKRWHLRLLRGLATEYGDRDVETLVHLAQSWEAEDPRRHVERALAFVDTFAELVVVKCPDLKVFAPWHTAALADLSAESHSALADIRRPTRNEGAAHIGARGEADPSGRVSQVVQ